MLGENVLYGAVLLLAGLVAIVTGVYLLFRNYRKKVKIAPIVRYRKLKVRRN